MIRVLCSSFKTMGWQHMLRKRRHGILHSLTWRGAEYFSMGFANPAFIHIDAGTSGIRLRA